MAFDWNNEPIVPVPTDQKSQSLKLVYFRNNYNNSYNTKYIKNVYHRENCVFIYKYSLEDNSIQFLVKKRQNKFERN